LVTLEKKGEAAEQGEERDKFSHGGEPRGEADNAELWVVDA